MRDWCKNEWAEFQHIWFRQCAMHGNELGTTPHSAKVVDKTKIPKQNARFQSKLALKWPKLLLTSTVWKMDFCANQTLREINLSSLKTSKTVILTTLTLCKIAYFFLLQTITSLTVFETELAKTITAIGDRLALLPQFLGADGRESLIWP